MKYHPIANVWPLMSDEDIQSLAKDIEANGQLNPIWLFEGMILDGRNRWAACQIAGVKPVTKEYTGDEPTAFAVSLNDKRRHMTKSALAAVGAELEPLFAEDAKRRQRASGGDRKSSDAKSVVEKIPQPIPDPAKARDEAAKSVGVNDRYVQDAKRIKTESPETFEKMKAGKISIQDAKREVAKIPTDDWREDERKRQREVEQGKAVVANQQVDKNLIAWAEKHGHAVRIDRGSKYGNPFILNDDGTRDHVCDCYEHNYLPNKPSILNSVDTLKGNVLICHCFPQRCHGDTLAAMANGQKRQESKKDPKQEAKQLRKLADKLDPPTKFVRPDLEEVSAYFRELNATDPDSFFDFYESKGWIVGKVSMKDWRASARKWVRENQVNGKGNGNGNHKGTGNGRSRGLTAEDVFSAESLGRGR